MAWYDQKIRKRLDALEQEARERPRLHAVRIFILALVGYLYPALLVLVCFTLVGVVLLATLTVWDSLAEGAIVLLIAALLGALVLTVIVIRTFFVKMPDLGGHPIARTYSPPLWDM